MHGCAFAQVVEEQDCRSQEADCDYDYEDCGAVR